MGWQRLAGLPTCWAVPYAAWPAEPTTVPAISASLSVHISAPAPSSSVAMRWTSAPLPSPPPTAAPSPQARAPATCSTGAVCARRVALLNRWRAGPRDRRGLGDPLKDDVAGISLPWCRRYRAAVDNRGIR